MTGRREADLRETARLVEEAGGEALPLVGSVCDAAVVARHAAAVRERWGGLDWLVLNAGIGDAVDARRFDAERFAEVLATNVGGAVNWLGAVLPWMIEAGSGTVAGISSLAAWRGLPRAGAYSASKAALATLLESARVDLRGTGVRVVTVFPGFIRNRGVPAARTGQAVPARPRGRRAAHPRRHRERPPGRPLPAPLSWPMRHVVRNLPAPAYDWLMGRLAPTDKP